MKPANVQSVSEDEIGLSYSSELHATVSSKNIKSDMEEEIELKPANIQSDSEDEIGSVYSPNELQASAAPACDNTLE